MILGTQRRHHKPPLRGGRASGRRGQGRGERRPRPRAEKGGENKSYKTDVYARTDFKAGARFVGPAIVEQVDSTVLIPPNWIGTVDQYMNITIRLED